MSLAIDVDDVRSVLLTDGWHEVLDESFSIDSYEYLWHDAGKEKDPMVLHGGGQSGISASGFAFLSELGGVRVRLAGPLTAILAVQRPA